MRMENVVAHEFVEEDLVDGCSARVSTYARLRRYHYDSCEFVYSIPKAIAEGLTLPWEEPIEGGAFNQLL